MLKRLFGPRPARAAGARLYAGAVAQARRPEFYRDLGVEDRIDARFELYTLHVILLVQRFSGQGPQAAETSQALFDTYLSALDDALRELGVGDLSVAKKMRKLGEAVYGRTRSYQALLTAEPDQAALQAQVAHTIWNEAPPAEQSAALAAYVTQAWMALAAQPLAEILQGQAAWPSPIRGAEQP